MQSIFLNSVILCKVKLLHRVVADFTESEKEAINGVSHTFSALNAVSYQSFIELAKKKINEGTSKTSLSDNYTHQAIKYQNNKLVIVPCQWRDHTAAAVLYKNNFDVSNTGGHTNISGIDRNQLILQITR